MVGMTLLVPIGLWLWKSGGFVGDLESRVRSCEKKADDLTDRIDTAVAQRIEEEKKKVDAAVLVASEARFDLQLKFLQERLTEIMTRMDKRFDDGSARMSDLNSKITSMVDTVRRDMGFMGERLARIEPHPQRRTGEVDA